MRKLVLTLAVWTAGAWVPLFAQQPPSAPPAQQPSPNQAVLVQHLETMLGVWENMLPGTQTVYAEFKAFRKYNAQNGMIRTYNGQTKFMRLADGTIGARVFLRQLDNAGKEMEKYELIICTGRDIYFVVPEEKTIYFQQLPVQKVGQVPDQGPLAFLFGMKKTEAKRRYKMDLTKKEDWYSYLNVWPLFERDAQEFTYARLVIMNQAVQTPQRNIPAFLPREFYWIEPNKNENTWDITFIRQNDPSRVLRTDFMKPPLQQGWQLKQMQQAPPAAAGNSQGGNPRIVRE